MKNPKTTIPGYFLLIGVLLQAVAMFMQGQTGQLGALYPQVAMAFGLIMAADGGH